MIERSFTSQKAYNDPFNEVELNVLITTPKKQVVRVPAFWAGGQTWRVRYASSQEGVHHYRTECSDTRNKDLHGVTGVIEVQSYQGNNPLYRRGPLRVAANNKHFEHADGTPFFWLADTWWMGLSQRLRWPEDFQMLTADRVGKGFTVVQIVAGLYPDMPAFDERGANEAGFPWERDYSRINPAYFDAADRRIQYLVDAGIVPCLVGAWGYHLPWLGVERMKQHWRYLVARYGAYPMFWCMAGEGMMPYYLSEHKAEDSTLQKKGWTEVARYVRQIDPYYHPLSIHPTDMARNQVEDARVLDFDMLQTGHGDRASIPNTINLVRASRAAVPTMPTINSEVTYEGILGNSFADVQRFMAWSCLLSGAAGHTYGANGIWQVNRREQPYGKSPHGGNWGETPWDEAMKLPGSQQTGFAKRLLEQYPWHRFEPHPEWASFNNTNISFNWGRWIWYPEGNPAHDAPIARRFFRRTFDLPLNARIVKAVLRLTVDDKFTAFVNGQQVGAHEGWKPWREFEVSNRLQPGKNLLAVQAENVHSAVQFNPAGLLCSLEITLDGGRKVEVLSDTAWRVAQQEAMGWTTVNFDDTTWKAALSIADYGAAPWGRLDDSDAFMVPYAAGIREQVRIIYVPAARSIQVHHLERNIRYRTRYFNPVTGTITNLGTATGDDNGSWSSPEPPVGTQDWVLILDRGQP